jgi:hypothetical protein
VKKIIFCAAILIPALAAIAYPAGYYATKSSTSLNGSANITGGNATLNNLAAVTANITSTLTANVATITGALYASASNLSGLRTDTAGNSSIPYIDASGNVVSLGLTNGLSLSGGNLTITAANITGLTASQVAGALSISGSNTVGNVALIGPNSTITDGGVVSSLLVRQVANFSFADSDAAVTVSASKKGYAVPAAYNGSNISSMTCAVYDLNSANANTTIINLSKMSNGTVTNVFDTGVNIANNAYYATSTDANATNAALLTGDYLFANVTAIADPAPKGLSCTFTFSK